MGTVKLAVSPAVEIGRNHRTVYLESVGCFIAQTETNHIAGYLTSNGYQLVDTVDEADAIILTTCAFIEERAEHTFRTILDYVARRSNKAHIYIVGCFTRTRLLKYLFHELTS